MKRFLFPVAMFAAFVSATDVLARQLTPDEALRAARASAAGAPQRVRALSSSDMRLAYTAGSASGLNSFYVFNDEGDGGGFIIVSADDLAPAVLGYSDGGTFDYDSAPENVKWWLSLYEQGIAEAARTGRRIARAETDGRDAVWQLLTTTWDQNYPYNTQCPMNTASGVRTYTGCVATAMAQIMYYHQWPEKGAGAHSYECKVDGNESLAAVLSADFGSTTYRWDDMLTDYFRTGYTSEQADAVATLMYHCGVSLDMLYGTDLTGGSAAYEQNAPRALKDYFGYDAGAQMKVRDFYTDDEWETVVYDELAEGRPVLYCGRSETSGHSFVCDGYDGNGRFHINWGWSGYYNGYFLMTGTGALTPEGTGIGGGAAGYGYTRYQTCITGIQKPQADTEAKVLVGCLYGYEIKCDDVEVTRESKLVFNGLMYNLSAVTEDVPLGVMFRSTTTDDVYYTTVGTVKDFIGGAYIYTFGFTASCVVKDGEYEIIPVYRHSADEKEWLVVECPVDMEFPKLTLTGNESDGIAGPHVDADSTVDVYSLTGVRLGGGASVGEAIDALPRGIYVVGGRKVIKK